MVTVLVLLCTTLIYAREPISPIPASHDVDPKVAALGKKLFFEVYEKLDAEIIPIILENMNENDAFETETAAFFRNVAKLETKHLPTLIRSANKYHKENIQGSKQEMR